jgi:anti-anti-sigma factor
MQIAHEHRGNYFLAKVTGKLDITWADHFTSTFLQHVRQGKHNILVDASQLTFLSSAGIRSLIMVYKELKTVNGSFQIVNATEFVTRILNTSGLQVLLATGLPSDFPDADTTISRPSLSATEVFTLNADAALNLSVHAAWHPWEKVDPLAIMKLDFPKTVFAIGIGSAAGQPEETRALMGEFLAIAGNVVYQPPDEDSRPDYLLSEGDFVPQLYAVQALLCQGEMSHLIRFAPDKDTTVFSVSEIAEMAMHHAGSNAVGFVVLGEIDGLVGASLIRSPGLIEHGEKVQFPEIRNWLSFCGERSYFNQQALLFGLAVRSSDNASLKLLPPTPQYKHLHTHIHSAVFPYQTLQNGKIELHDSVKKFFNGPPPLGLLHLVNDSRPLAGFGQSSLIRGACWCAPINNQEVLL